ncbi:MAG: PIN domain-containing protein [Acidobacteria bacterium]|nr:PIN domain-containing protein [Acidobacteriota bacterium]
MSGKCFVDTNILVYAHDRTAGRKHERARETVETLWANRNGVLSTQVLQELCINVRRKILEPLSIREAQDLVQDYMAWEVVVNTPASVLKALEIEERYRLSFWDALIVHAAEASGAAILYSEDLAPGQRYGAVEVISPLLEPAL